MAAKSGELSIKKEAKAPVSKAGRHPLTSLRHEMDRVFDEFASSYFPFPFRSRFFDLEPFRALETMTGTTVPNVDVVETDKDFEITAELPGMDEEDIELTMSDGVLTLRGEKKEEVEEKKEGYYLAERRFGSFQRSFRVPETVDTEKVEARCDKGVLTIVLPKTKEAQKEVRKIAVKKH